MCGASAGALQIGASEMRRLVSRHLGWARPSSVRLVARSRRGRRETARKKTSSALYRGIGDPVLRRNGLRPVQVFRAVDASCVATGAPQASSRAKQALQPVSVREAHASCAGRRKRASSAGPVFVVSATAFGRRRQVAVVARDGVQLGRRRRRTDGNRGAGLFAASPQRTMTILSATRRGIAAEARQTFGAFGRRAARVHSVNRGER